MPDQYGNPTEAELRGQVSAAQPYIRPQDLAAAIRAREEAARAGEGTLDIYRGDGSSSHLTGSQLRASTDPELVAHRENMARSGVSDPNMLFGPEGGREQSPEERAYRHAYHNLMRNPNKGVDHNEAIRALGMWAAAVGAAYALPAAGAGAGAGSGAGGLTTMTAAEQAAITAGLSAPGAAAGAGAAGAGAAGAAAALPEIVVTGTLGSGGLAAGEAAALGAGAAGAGAAAGSAPTNYGDYGGWQANSDPVGSLANTQYGGSAGQLGQSGAIQGGAGMGSATEAGSSMSMRDYADIASDLMGGGGGQQQQAAPEPWKPKASNPAFQHFAVTPGAPITYTQKLARALQHA